MNTDNTPAAAQLAYLSKVLIGLSALAALVLLALWLPHVNLPITQQRLATAALVLAAVALVPMVHWAYRRCDEMLQLQHQRASMHALAWCAAVSTVCGVLQAADWVPLFSQFWTLGLVLVAWGFQLVWADRQHKA